MLWTPEDLDVGFSIKSILTHDGPVTTVLQRSPAFQILLLFALILLLAVLYQTLDI